MKNILGLDLGTNSIGWALVKERENDNEQSSIMRLGVREIYLTADEQSNFEKVSRLLQMLIVLRNAVCAETYSGINFVVTTS